MPPEIGIFTTTLYQLIGAVTLGLSNVMGDVRMLFGFCISMAWSLGVIFWLWSGSPAMVGGMIKMLTLIIAVGWVLEFLPNNWYTLANDAVSVGETVFPEGGELSASDPSSAFWFFWQIASFIMKRIGELLFDWKILFNMPELLVYVPSWLAVVAAGGIMVVFLFLAWVELAVMMIPVVICAATAVFSPIASLAEKALGYFLGSMLRLVGYGSLIGVLGLSVSTLKFAEGVVVSKIQAIGVGVMCLVIIALVLVINKVTGRIGGGLDLAQAVSALWRSAGAGGKAAMAAGRAAMAAGGAATGGASAALAATSAAIQGATERDAGGSGGSGGSSSGGSSGSGSEASGWKGTLQQAGVDTGSMSAEQGKAAAAAINSEAQHRAAAGGEAAPISKQTAQWIASAANSPATPSQAASLYSIGVDAGGMTKWQAFEQIRSARQAGKNI